MADDDVERRLRGLENKVWIATGAAFVFAAWFGVANLYYIPTSVQNAVDKSTSGETAKKITKLLDNAQQESEKVAKIAQNGTILVGGKCFKPRLYKLCQDGHNTVFGFLDEKNQCLPHGNDLRHEAFFLVQCEGG